MNPGLVGGLIGAGLGVVGGMAGSYLSIKNTLGPAERAFMVRVAVITWLGVTAFVLGLLLLPSPFRYLLWIPYGVALPLGIRWCNARQRQIRAAEAAAKSGS